MQQALESGPYGDPGHVGEARHDCPPSGAGEEQGPAPLVQHGTDIPRRSPRPAAPRPARAPVYTCRASDGTPRTRGPTFPIPRCPQGVGSALGRSPRAGLASEDAGLPWEHWVSQEANTEHLLR